VTALLEQAPVRKEARGDPWRRWLLAACAAVVVARLTFLGQPLRSDEGGYLMVARQWHAGGEFLYGDYHVDRPPLLMLMFRLAAVTEWDGAIRVLSIPFALAFVLAAARAAYLLAGPAGARWSAVVAAAFICSPAFAADQADGELFAAPLVMAAVALTVDAWQRAPGLARFWVATAAGVLAAAASLVKQNFLEGFVFAGVLVVAEALRRRRVTGRCRTVAAGVAVGACCRTSRSRPGP
jgi:4-amino-4-deoxy-L-arabinose transferase-like glycosyltransferase